jgi:hypothetical protein
MSTARNFRIAVTQGVSGYFAVMIADYEDMDWNADVVQTGIGRYKTRDKAEQEAKSWAEEEEIPYVG